MTIHWTAFGQTGNLFGQLNELFGDVGIFSPFCAVLLWGVFLFALIFWFFYEFTSIESSHLLPKKQCNYMCNNQEWKSCVLFNPQVFDGKRDRKVLFLPIEWVRVWYKNNTSDSFVIVHIFFYLVKQQHLNRSLPWTHNLTLKIIQKHHIWHLYFNVFNNYAAIFGENNGFHSTSDLCHDHTIQKNVDGKLWKRELQDIIVCDCA